jgi:hypothetical protein
MWRRNWIRRRKDRQVGIRTTEQRVPSTRRPQTVQKRKSRAAIEGLRTISLVELITVSPYWYIRGVIPRRRIRAMVIRESARLF